MKNLCVCIPTYNSKLNIEKFLTSQMDMFQTRNVDVYIYDSSDDNMIEKYVIECINVKYNNLFYIQKPSNMSSNAKVYDIFRDMTDSDYKYLWMIHDHTICSERALDYLLEVIQGQDDFYVLNMQADKESVYKYNSLNEFIFNSAWRLNSFGASVIRIDTFLKNVDWEYMSNKYNDSITLNYSHIGFYFERASEISNLSAKEVFFERKDFIDFNREKNISWSSETLRICLECWGNVIEKLPNVYTNKEDVLRTQDRWFMSKYSLMTYKKKGYYGLTEFCRYSKWIKLIYKNDYFKDLMIALLPYKISNYFMSRKLYSNIHYIRKNDGRVFIYGAGRHGVECGNYLELNNIKFNGYMVTKKEGNPDRIKGVPVVEIDSQYFDQAALIIIAVLTSGVESVKRTLEEYTNKFTKIVVFGEE